VTSDEKETKPPRSVVTHSPEETVAFGAQLARELKPPVLVLLLGDLGAGKTTLAKGLVAGLGAAPEEEVTSPTFTLIHEYGTAGDSATRVYHVDLYRVETARELETLGLEDLLAENAIVIVEWGEKLGPALRPVGSGSVVEIHLEAVSENERRIGVRT
jgi:tRNA threonylcarbamoyladenosine biosynthesis protein TsaE